MDNGRTSADESANVRNLNEPLTSKSSNPKSPLGVANKTEASNVGIDPHESSLVEPHEKNKGVEEDESTEDPEEDVEAQESEAATPVNEKTKLQDQTNILPFKQLAVVFLGLSSALFCEFLSFYFTPFFSSLSFPVRFLGFTLVNVCNI